MARKLLLVVPGCHSGPCLNTSTGKRYSGHYLRALERQEPDSVGPLGYTGKSQRVDAAVQRNYRHQRLFKKEVAIDKQGTRRIAS